jgi:rhodanese-related sulfurtransferase
MTSVHAKSTRLWRPRRLRQGVFVEAAAVAMVGLLLGFLANGISPRGLKLERDYFPQAAAFVTGIATNQPAAAGITPPPTNAVLARLRAQGLHPLDHEAVAALFRESERNPATVIFVDVRNDALYQAGHIPGAYQLDYYRPEAYLPDVLGACATAQKILVYCTGGDCEDSELAAHLLIQAGVPRENVFVYLGGFTEWSTNGFPLQMGARLRANLEGGGL